MFTGTTKMALFFTGQNNSVQMQKTFPELVSKLCWWQMCFTC